MIFDCFTFFDEFLLLDIRLRELDGVVDRFVLVEATHTFQGDRKPLHFLESADRYAEWNDRIIHVIADVDGLTTTWDREYAQRRAIAQGLAGSSPDDLVIVGDADEIPRPEIVLELDRALREPARLRYRFYYYHFNTRAAYAEPWDLPRALRSRDVGDLSELRAERPLNVVDEAGWHFSYLMPPERIARKLETFSHIELNKTWYKSRQHVDRCIKLGVDLYGRGVLSVERPQELPASVAMVSAAEAFIRPARPLTQTLLAHLYRPVALDRGRLPQSVADHAPYVLVPFAVTMRLPRLVKGAVRRVLRFYRRKRAR